MKIIKEKTYGSHIYMKLELDGNTYEIDCYLRNGYETYYTSADGTEMRDLVIYAFNQLYWMEI